MANTKWDIWFLFFLAFTDAIFLPLPVTTFFLVLLIMNPIRSVRYVVYSSIGTLAGAFTGYLIGHYIFLNVNGGFTGLGQFMFEHIPGFSEDNYNRMQGLYSKWDFWILFGASFTPIPYGVFAITSGVFKVNLIKFCISTLISQVLKFSLLALLTTKLGIYVRRISEFKFKPAGIVVIAFIAIIILVAKNII